MKRQLAAAAAAAAACLIAGCSCLSPGSRSGPGTRWGVRGTLPPDPRTASALFKIATAFNNDYDSGDYAPVYARWDARSQAIITRAQYVKRHRDCPGAPHAAAQVQSATPGPHGAWLVDYEIGGQRLTDYWFYLHRHWVFDLVLSNPGSVKLYRMTPQAYATAAGCSHG